MSACPAMTLIPRASQPGAHSAATSLAALAVALLLSACTTVTHRAPVEHREPPPPSTVGVLGQTPSEPAASPAGAASAPAPAAPAPVVTDATTAPKPLPGAENAGQPGYYTVRQGDTLIRIGLEQGQSWRDIARWNGIENPNVLEVGQTLRVAPPAAEQVAVRPLPPLGGPATSPPGGTAGTTPPGRPADTPASPPATPPASPPAALPAHNPEGDLAWSWPAAGPVATAFDEVRSKGLAITGKAGDPVLAAADGRVVYAGSGLRGYGNLVIVKHNATYLTAYAHNQALLVREDQVVRRGQKIAEMGSSDADRVQLHFEIRREGKPVDPARLLPPR